MLITPDSPQHEGCCLKLETRLRRPINNLQPATISLLDRSMFGKYAQAYPHIPRSEPCPAFNCHGLTFASRRTAISDSEELRKILDDDGYSEVKPQDVLPGDVIMYFSSQDGDYQHSGIVVEAPKPGILSHFPRVISKWGKFKEVIHFANQCPYEYGNVRYYRIQK